MRPRRAERGLGLLECIAALAVAGLAASASTRSMTMSARLVAETRHANDTLTVARNLLEHAAGAPCSPPRPCPDGYRCDVSAAALAPGFQRLIARAEPERGGSREELRTLARVVACTG